MSLRGGDREDRRRDPVRMLRHPRLRRPVVLASFEGWNDAGQAASRATEFIAKSWSAVSFAEIESEEFFDFTATRPQVRIVKGVTRTIVWPDTVLLAARPPQLGFDVVILRATEPQMRWRTYADAVVRIAREIRAELVLTYGALLAEVTHTRPIEVTATSADHRLFDRHQLPLTGYEGPTGIIGVLNLALTNVGIPAASLWASVPYYSSAVASSAALALIQKTEVLLGCRFATEELEAEVAQYRETMDELVADDEHIAAYVAHLEEVGAGQLDRGRLVDGGLDLPIELTGEELAVEIESYLRQHRRS
jgi:hypothetical protein